jgi:hypothetical protein
VALNYSSGTGAAAIQVDGVDGAGKIVMFGFPFETMTNATRRQQAMERILDYFGVAPIAPNADFNADTNIDGRDYVIWRKNSGIPSGATLEQGDANGDGAVDDTDYDYWRSQFNVIAGAGSGASTANNVAQQNPATTASSTPAANTSEVGTSRTTSLNVVSRDFAFEQLGRTVSPLREWHRSIDSLSAARREFDRDGTALLTLSAARNTGSPIASIGTDSEQDLPVGDVTDADKRDAACELIGRWKMARAVL